MTWSMVDTVTALVCRYRGHRWEPFSATRGAEDRLMRWAVHDYCTCCEAHRLRFLAHRRDLSDRQVLTGEELVVERAGVLGLSPAWLEGLYQARWGELPWQRVAVGGRFPDDWQWDVRGAM